MENNEKKSGPDFLNEKAEIKNRVKMSKDGGLKRGVLITMIIGFILLVSAGVIFYSLYNREHIRQLSLIEQQRRTFANQLNTRDSLINDWVLTFDQVEKDLWTIKEKEKLITLNSSDREFPKDKKDQILSDIKYINSLLDQNKAKIASLSAQLKKSGVIIKGLQDKIADLEASMKQSENEIAELKTGLVNKDFEIGQLNTRMSGLQAEIVKKDEEISNQTNDMNKAFLASGTYQDLKKMGLVSKTGGFLGLGRKESLITSFPDSLFSRIDINVTKTIEVNSKNVKLISRHPSSSYELVHDNKNKIAYIEIKDPDQFWKISRYAVVEIIN